MEFNPSKPNIMCFPTRRDPPKREYVFCGEILEEVESHPYLGVMLDNKMRWSPHIEIITSRANDVLRLMKLNLLNCSKSVKETAYTTLVRPKLQYACNTWDPHYQKDKAALERVASSRRSVSEARKKNRARQKKKRGEAGERGESFFAFLPVFPLNDPSAARRFSLLPTI